MGTRYIQNDGSTGSVDDTPMYGSNAVFLNGTNQSVPLKIVHQLGAEEVPNGDFSNGFTGWTSANSTENVSSGACVLTADADNAYITTGANIALIGGVNYRCYAYIKNDMSVNDVYLQIYKSGYAAVQTIKVVSAGETFDDYFEFIANPDMVILVVMMGSGAVGETITIDNLYIQAITTDSSHLTYISPLNQAVTTLDMSTVLSTIYDMEDSHSNTFATDVVVTQDDRDYIQINPETVYNMWKSGIQNPNLSFAPSNIKHLYLGNSAGLGGDVEHDVVTNTSATIVNPTPEVWTTYKNENTGISNFLLVMNASGEVINVVTSGTIVGANDGRYLKLPLVTPQDKTILKDVDKIEGSDASLTIYYTDETTEEIT